MDEEIRAEYEKIKDKLSYEEFLEKIKQISGEYEDVAFMSDASAASIIVNKYLDQENEPLYEDNPHIKIAELETGQHDVTLTGRVMRISNIKRFTSRKGREGKLANVLLADDSGDIRVVFWTENIKLLKKIKEGDVIRISGVEIKQGYKDDEAHLNLKSSLEVLNSEEYENFPPYEEKITNIADIKGDDEVNIIARIIRIPRIRKFTRNGREGRFASLELKDKTGTIRYTLWNKDTDLIESLELHEGDSVKIIGAQSRVRDGEISLSHPWLGRIIKDDFDVPEYEEKSLKIGDSHEMRDVTLIGVVSKIYDTITFMRDDGSTGNVKSIEMKDETGSIRVTLWNEDTEMELNKKDIIKIVGGNIEFDEYSETGYRVNTNWNSKIMINPPIDSKTKEILEECVKYLEPVKIKDLLDIDEEGEEIDVIGILTKLQPESTEFTREDGSTGKVRSAELLDNTGRIRISLWDDKAEMPLENKKAIKIENARTRLGTYQVELSIGRTSRIMSPSVEETLELPNPDEIDDLIYETKKIEDLEENDQDIQIIGRILHTENPREFIRNDGRPGLVRTAELGDGSGVIRMSLWEDKADYPLKEGELVKIENPRITFRNGHLEMSLGRTSTITPVEENEELNIPSLEKIEEKRYPLKNLEDIKETDKNIKIRGRVIDAFGENILIEMCPNCNKKITYAEEGLYCEYCGEQIEKAKHLMIIPLKIEDETGTMRVTFFQQEAEKLIGMKTSEVEKIVQNSGDQTSLEDKVHDLINTEITIIADARIDDYNEELTLTARKLVEIQY